MKILPAALLTLTMILVSVRGSADEFSDGARKALEAIGFESEISLAVDTHVFESNRQRLIDALAARPFGLLIKVGAVDIIPADSSPYFSIAVVNRYENGAFVSDADWLGSQVIYGFATRRITNWDEAVANARFWSDGPIEYAALDVEYEIVPKTEQLRSLVDSFGERELRLVVRKHPAVGHWESTSFAGVGTNFPNDDAGLARQVLLNLAPAYKAHFLAGVETAYADSMEELLKSEFHNYRVLGSIMYIRIEGTEYLVSRRPRLVNLYTPNYRVCEQTMRNDELSGWRMPNQFELAVLLQGARFSEWRRFNLKDTSDGRFWGWLVDEAYRGVRSRLSSRGFILASNVHERPHHVYVVQVERQARVFDGRAVYVGLQSFHDPGSGVTACITTEAEAIRTFRARLRQSESADQSPQLPLSSEQLVGTWTGTALQPDAANQTEYSLRLVFGAGEGDILVVESDYPTLDCKGTLRLLEAGPDSLALRETIERGAGRCMDGNVALRMRADGRMEWSWSYLDGQLGATATLARSE